MVASCSHCFGPRARVRLSQPFVTAMLCVCTETTDLTWAASVENGVFISSGPAFLTILRQSLAEKDDKKQAEKERGF